MSEMCNCHTKQPAKVLKCHSQNKAKNSAKMSIIGNKVRTASAVVQSASKTHSSCRLYYMVCSQLEVIWSSILNIPNSRN